jgi:cellulose biosynthesis protein BcsQ
MFESIKRRELKTNLKILGILLTKVHNGTNMSIETLSLSRTQFSDLVFPVTIDFTIKYSKPKQVCMEFL